ncbi:MAG TPA: sigma-70 family RNA polymerase sigma factor [Lacunisphaera sp.]|nr:sigma-70 family RNA polymerase sigma factor [Lacunisphaera sp.]
MSSPLDYCTCSDRQLVALHLDGDRDAFRQIVERYQAMVCALGFSACGDVARSEDIAQEVFFVVWKQLPELRDPDRLRAWIGSIARNLIHQAFRRQLRTPTAVAGPLSDETPAAGGTPRDAAVRADEAAAVWQALEGMPEIYREPMVLFYREQESVPAVAAALEISEELARQRLVRGRAMLTERMAKLVEESLGRTGPTAVFAGGVMLSVALGTATPATAAAEVAAGGTLAKVATTAGVVGGAAAKGGMFVKIFSVVALLPALYGGAVDFLRFRARHERLKDETERWRIARAYFLMHASSGVFVLALLIPGCVLRDPSLPVCLTFALLALAALGVLVRAAREVRQSLPEGVSVGYLPRPEHAGALFERRSRITFLGWPLHHVRLGSKGGWRQPPVKAWIVVSDGRAVGGLFAMGVGAIAPVSVGFGAIGLCSFGLVALGLDTLGVVSVGRIAYGYFAAGFQAAKGIVAWAGEFAGGAIASAPHTNDLTAKAFFDDSAWTAAVHYLGQVAMLTVWAGWVMPLLLGGWHLWRIRRQA